jgi:hypothetical protein
MLGSDPHMLLLKAFCIRCLRTRLITRVNHTPPSLEKAHSCEASYSIFGFLAAASSSRRIPLRTDTSWTESTSPAPLKQNSPFQGLRGCEFCPFSPIFANFSTFTKIPQVPSFQAHSPVKTVFRQNPKNARKSQNTPSTNPYQNDTQFPLSSLKNATSGHARPPKSVLCPPVISGTNSDLVDFAD